MVAQCVVSKHATHASLVSTGVNKGNEYDELGDVGWWGGGGQHGNGWVGGGSKPKWRKARCSILAYFHYFSCA